jgi:Big-like domain-containing protein
MFRALRTALLLKLALVATLAGVIGCTLNTDVSGPSGILKFSGDPQPTPANTPLAGPLQVIVFTQFGERLQNVTVNWTIVSGGGTLSATSTLTDDGGVASVDYTTGPTAGQAKVQARVSGLPALTFNITVT